ncbi:MAG TPA: tyrosinase family protein [Longimicrobium sp.]|jgi:tyrosinase|uniref:tyrosinase family protein n=1 Tax=Longimicrobium sp. TaxID=2029185 RepID=UPI002EDA100B
MAKATTTTRWERVQEILQRAHPEEPVYAGAGRFWMNLDTLLAAEIHGVRMVAPAQGAGSTGTGCGCGTPGCGGGAADTGGEPGTRYPGRGAASGLVKGLRGQPPFDGSRLPRLPWGGPRVDEDDVRFISDWIDDGCPTGDHRQGQLAVIQLRGGPVQRMEPLAVDGDTAARLTREAARVFGTGPAASSRPEVQQRMNLDCMDDAQLEQLRYAFRELYALNKWPRDYRNYNNLALIHQDHCQHGWERFLPWHRVYLYEFEQAMQDVCPGVTMPYWDWTMPQYHPYQPYKGWIIPQSFKAYITPEMFQVLKPHLNADQAREVERKLVEPRRHFTSLPKFLGALGKLDGFGTIDPELERHLIDALVHSNPLWYPLRFPAEYQDGGGNPQTINEAIHYHYPSPKDMDEIMSLRSWRDFGGGSQYNDAFGFLDQNPHNTMHIWTGGQNPRYRKPPAESSSKAMREQPYMERNRMVRVAGRPFHTKQEFYAWRSAQYGDMFSNLTAAYDPIFWPVHANVDRLWWEWQQLNPNAQPVEQSSVLTPWGYTVADTLDMTRFGYEYVRCAFSIPVGLQAPVGRFVSEPVKVPKGARDPRRVEVRLHRVPQLDRSCFVRVFLNLPDANANTPPEGDHFGGYLAVFGHGECFGGPGHCAIPGQARPYDLRPRSHNTPRNHRVNVTQAARALLEKGAATLQVTLVAIGADYREENELLRMEGLSLNFLD